jgi:hypothetical protein
VSGATAGDGRHDAAGLIGRRRLKRNHS